MAASQKAEVALQAAKSKAMAAQKRLQDKLATIKTQAATRVARAVAAEQDNKKTQKPRSGDSRPHAVPPGGRRRIYGCDTAVTTTG